jgi:predicted phage tail protein
VAYLDAAICGNSEELRRGDVLVVAGGPAAAFEACQDVFATFARRSWRIERKRADVGLWFHVKTTAPGVSRCVDDSVNVVLPGKTYTYRVAAFNAGGLSAYSGEVAVTTPAVTVPSAPTNLKATVVSPTQINLTWTDTSNNEDGFKLECKAGEAAEWKPVMGRTPANWTLFTDYGLEPGRTYAYRIRAFNAAGESAWSNEVTAQTAQRK